MKNNRTVSWPRMAVTVLLAATILSMNSCKEEEPEIYNFGVSSEDFMQIFLTYSHLYFHVDEIMASAEDSLQKYPGGSYLWKDIQVGFEPADTETFPKTFTIHYGAARFPDSIQGTVSGTLSDHYLKAGTLVEYGFVDLMVYAGKVGGTCSIECLGNVEGRPSFQFDLTGGRIEKHFGTDSAAVISLNGSQEAFYDETASTLFIPGGTFSGMASDSMEYLAVVDDYYPFIKERDCTYIRDGIFSYTVKNAAGAEIGNGVVDFGYVDPMICDKYAIVVVDGDGYRSEYYYIMGW